MKLKPPGNLRIGTSGYSYADWRGNWYPKDLPDRGMLEEYARVFSAVEINFTYYRMPTARTTSSMVRRTAERFLFTLKSHGCFTHDRCYGDGDVRLFRDGAAPLAEAGKLGVLLHQFPFSFRNTPENRQYLLGLRDRFVPWAQVVEFRHRSWHTPEIIDFLRGEGIGICCVDEPDLPGLMPPFAEVTSDAAYLRFHGRNSAKWFEHEEAAERYDYNYSREEIGPWVERIRQMSGKASTAFVFFNNHVNGQAPMNAEMLMGMLGLEVPGRLGGGEPTLF